MDIKVNLKVNFRSKAENFVVSDSGKTNWESMEAMIKRSFGLDSLQVTYFDEENEEVSINSQGEYEEALKSAVQQGNQLHMKAYETKARALRELQSRVRPAQHEGSGAMATNQRTQAPSEQSLVIIKKLKGTREEDKTPPAWFTSYMEKFKEQVVREAVEKICREFSGQCCIHKPLGDAQGAEVSSSTVMGASSSTIDCSSCQSRTSGGGYQCSVCTSCTLCESCSYAHDPSHSLVRAGTPLSIPEHGALAVDHTRFQRRVDRSFRKAEKLRLKAEKRQLKAEVKEIKKQLRMERKGLPWSGDGDGGDPPVLLQPRGTQTTSPGPKRSYPPVVPALSAQVLDENLPDGVRLQPGTKFTKQWKMRNNGAIFWTSETKLKFMWGNLTPELSDSEQKEVGVPFLPPGQVGLLSVAFTTPALEGTYTSHWRLAHCGQQFGPRVWCSVVVDPWAPAGVPTSWEPGSPCAGRKEKDSHFQEKVKNCSGSRDCALMSMDLDCKQEYYIPSVDLLTAQDLLSFELLDINIVQELESVPDHTHTDTTPCMSPLLHDVSQQEKPGLRRTTQEVQVPDNSSPLAHCRQKPEAASDARVTSVAAPPPAMTQVIQEELPMSEEGVESDIENICMDPSGEDEEGVVDERDTTRSQASSASSEDYIIILPDCFDISRPLGESIYSSALSQSCTEGLASKAADHQPLDQGTPVGEQEEGASVNDMLCASQTLDAIPLTPMVVTGPPSHAHRPERPDKIELVEDHQRPEDTMDGSNSPVLSQSASPSNTCDSPTLGLQQTWQTQGP